MAESAEVHGAGSCQAVLLVPSLLAMSRWGEGGMTAIAVMGVCRVAPRAGISRCLGAGAVLAGPSLGMWHREAVTCPAVVLRVTAHTSGVASLGGSSMRSLSPPNRMGYVDAVTGRAHLRAMTQRAVSHRFPGRCPVVREPVGGAVR